MANRVTAAQVKVILDTDLADAAVDVFITTANTLINEKLLNKGLSNPMLDQIELWLSAHYAAMHRDSRQSRTTMEEIGQSEEQYGGQTGLGLDFTRFGQQVKILDTSGSLASAGLKRAGLVVV